MANALLKHLTLGLTTYDLADEEARRLYKALGAAAHKAVAESVTASTDLPTAAAVKNYVDGKVGAIHNFDVVVLKDLEELPTASAATMYKIYLKPDKEASAGSYVEYITLKNGGLEKSIDTYAWEKIGSTKTDLTGYVSNETTIAGQRLNHNVTAEELSKGLSLGALATKSAVSGTVAQTTVSGVKATGTTTGSINVALKQTGTAATVNKVAYTPAGTVTGTVKPTGTVSMVKSDGLTGTQISGSVSQPDVNVTAPTSTFVTGIKQEGVLPTFKAGEFKAATLAKVSKKLPTNAYTASVSGETLTLAPAATENIDTCGAFNGGSLGEFSFTQGSMPTYNTGNAVTSATAALANAPTFTGD